MKAISKKEFEEIRFWFYRNARHLELALWQYYFENGSKEKVLSALSYYQNNDGGFGQALEPDSWNPNSSPYTTSKVIQILKEIEFEDIQHPIIQGIFKYLESGVYCSEYGWNFNIPSNDDYPHAPWWTYNEEANAVEGIGVTAEIVSYILKFTDKEAELYRKAIAFTDILLSKLAAADNFGDMGIGGYCILLNSIRQSELAARYDFHALTVRLCQLVNRSIVRETSKWPFYGVRPSDYIKSPESPYYKGNEEIVATELDYLIDTRHEAGVWDITWSWFENNEKYAKEFAISENWWKAIKAIDNVNFLRNFNRIDF